MILKHTLIRPYYYRLVFSATLVALLTGCSGCKPSDYSGRYISPVPCKTPQERRQLFAKIGIQYSSQLKFGKGCKHLAHLRPQDYSGYRDNEKEYDEPTVRYGDKIARGYVANVSIRFISKKVGYGIFLEAEGGLEEDDLFAEYTGEVCTDSSGKYAWSYPPGGNATLRGKKYSLDASRCGNEACLVNHSDDPNLKMKFVYQGGAWHVVYVARRHIRQGEQLLVSYGSSYWNNREKVDL